jgi:hypothetical protein
MQSSVDKYLYKTPILAKAGLFSQIHNVIKSQSLIGSHKVTKS